VLTRFKNFVNLLVTYPPKTNRAQSHPASAAHTVSTASFFRFGDVLDRFVEFTLAPGRGVTDPDTENEKS
jgi:hypothetical protein